MADLLANYRNWVMDDGRTASAVRQEVLLDVVAVRLEQHARAAVLAHLLRRPLDHAVTLAGEGRFHLAAGGDLEALFGARLGLDLGHFALLRSAFDHGKEPGQPVLLVMSVLIGSASSPRQPLTAGRRRGGLWQKGA